MMWLLYSLICVTMLYASSAEDCITFSTVRQMRNIKIVTSSPRFMNSCYKCGEKACQEIEETETIIKHGISEVTIKGDLPAKEKTPHVKELDMESLALHTAGASFIAFILPFITNTLLAITVSMRTFFSHLLRVNRRIDFWSVIKRTTSNAIDRLFYADPAIQKTSDLETDDYHSLLLKAIRLYQLNQIVRL